MRHTIHCSNFCVNLVLVFLNGDCDFSFQTVIVALVLNSDCDFSFQMVIVTLLLKW